MALHQEYQIPAMKILGETAASYSPNMEIFPQYRLPPLIPTQRPNIFVLVPEPKNAIQESLCVKNYAHLLILSRFLPKQNREFELAINEMKNNCSEQYSAMARAYWQSGRIYQFQKKYHKKGDVNGIDLEVCLPW